MQYTFKNAEVKINGNAILAESVNFALNSQIDNIFREGNPNSYEFSPTNGVDNSMSLNYYLTGVDSLREYIHLESGYISGYFGGLYFQSGYLTNYGFTANPNNPIVVNSTIKFFEPLTGSFTSTNNSATDYKILNIADVTVTGSSLGSLDDIDSVSYNFTSNVTPQYIIGETKPRKVLIEDKEITMQINGVNITGNLPAEGVWADYQITLAHPEISSLSEQYFVNGKIANRSIQTQANGEIKTSLTIKQSYTKKRPYITSVSPTEMYVGRTINVAGKNLLNTEKVLFCTNGESIPRLEASFTKGSDNLLRVVVPQGASRGILELRP